MRILNVATRDTGGTGRNTALAFERHAPDWTYHAVKLHAKPSYANWLEYPSHTPWEQAAELATQADVIHVRNWLKPAQMLDALHKPLVWHHHGALFRDNAQRLLEDQRRHDAIGLASTLDLWLLAPDELEWVPAPLHLEWMAMQRNQSDDGVLRIGHAPTNRDIKSTEPFLRAVDRLSRETPVEVVLIEHKPWEECLQLKGTCDVYFDQVLLGYGNNAIEAWGMGIPVVAGGADDTLDEMERRFGSLPFVVADEGTIYDALASLVDPDARAEWSRRGLDHVSQWHDEKRVVDQLKRIYERAAG